MGRLYWGMSMQPSSILSAGNFKAMLGAGAAGTALVATGCTYRALLEPHWLSIERVKISLRRLSPEFDGFTLAQISDIHRGPYLTMRRLSGGQGCQSTAA